MKKKLLCLVLALLMLCSICLTSCADTRTEDEIIEDIVSNAKDLALTFTIMIPTDADTSDPEFQARLAAVEEAINTKLRQDCTEIKIIAVNDAEYDAALKNKMSTLKSAIAAGGIKPSTYDHLQKDKSGKAVNVAGKVFGANGDETDYTIQLMYPEVHANQLDIILIRNEEDYVNFYKAGQLSSWMDDLAGSGKYFRINKIIRSDILDLMRLGDKDEVFGIPNNHLYSDGKYQYMLLNKSVASYMTDFDPENPDVAKFAEEASKILNVVPFSATLDEVPFSYWGNGNKFSLVGSDSNFDGAPVSVFDDAGFVSFMQLYKKYNQADVAEGAKVAVSFFEGTFEEAKALEKDYYLYKMEVPEITREEVFSSVFAVTDYSVNYDRAKNLVFTLQTDEEIRTLLQYGIKGDDYEIEDGVLEMIKNNSGKYAYKMNSLYTGNGYITYPGDGMSMEYWEDVKDANYDSIIDTYEGFQEYYNKLSNKAEIDAKIAALNALSDIVYADLLTMTEEECTLFVAEWNNPNTTNEKVLAIKNATAYKEGLETLQNLYKDFAASR